MVFYCMVASYFTYPALGLLSAQSCERQRESIHRERKRELKQPQSWWPQVPAPLFVTVNILLPITTPQEYTPALDYSPSRQKDGDKRGDEDNNNRGDSNLLYCEYFECRVLQCYCKKKANAYRKRIWYELMHFAYVTKGNKQFNLKRSCSWAGNYSLYIYIFKKICKSLRSIFGVKIIEKKQFFFKVKDYNIHLLQDKNIYFSVLIFQECSFLTHLHIHTNTHTPHISHTHTHYTLHTHTTHYTHTPHTFFSI